jgi:hypothetical protein
MAVTVVSIEVAFVVRGNGGMLGVELELLRSD